MIMGRVKRRPSRHGDRADVHMLLEAVGHGCGCTMMLSCGQIKFKQKIGASSSPLRTFRRSTISVLT